MNMTYDTLTCNNYNTELIELIKQTITQTGGLNDVVEQRDRKHVEVSLNTVLQVRNIPEEIGIANYLKKKAIKLEDGSRLNLIQIKRRIRLHPAFYISAAFSAHSIDISTSVH